MTRAAPLKRPLPKWPSTNFTRSSKFPKADHTEYVNRFMTSWRPDKLLPGPITAKAIPSHFEALIHLKVYKEPRYDSPTHPGRLVQPGTRFTVTDLVE
eukprot:CAMPEP_0197701988 /NCGR_PEP_ID=MMETSP1338-20131121/123944_1 /TAXON_ID=43686 ORGANISM="Pelagodinium beii, Strain RCC1491" /NCGR_SAMPLE_ID=MMETSP1338 /ASSEMBLY_ACC=CAM_ASM_000754 /LENGTH=97 /DNA_ID=CAMNT_0043285757 /DNA_START=115 /DNA_END=405 /DNA_ORIENTATION=+